MKGWYIVGGGIIGFLIALILPGAVTLITAAICIALGIAAGVILSAVFLGRSRGEKPEDIVREVVREVRTPDPDARERAVYEPLVRGNQSLRLDGNVSATVLLAFESLIDKLRAIAPKAFALSPSSEMTYELEKLGSTHLPDYIAKYLELSGENRSAREGKLLEQLKTIDDVISKAKDRLERGLVTEFETQHGFMDLKF